MSASDEDRIVVITGANEVIGYHMLRGDQVSRANHAARRRLPGRRAGSERENILSLRGAYGDRVRYEGCDVAADGDVGTAVDEILDRWDRIDALVNDAAIFNFAPFDGQTIADTRREFEVNYFGSVRTIRAVSPDMRARESGVIHNVRSGVGLVGHPGLTGYASSKAAVEGLVRPLRLELRHEPVSCTLMHPPLSNTRTAAELGARSR